jgi:hypothetical protein
MTVLSLDCSPRANGTLPYDQRQPDCSAASVHLPGPQAGMGSLQRVRLDDQELHQDSDGHQAGVAGKDGAAVLRHE